SAASPGPSRPEGPNSSKTSRFATVPTAAGTFSPRRPILRLDGHGYSPAVLRMIVTAGTRLHSFAAAGLAVGRGGGPITGGGAVRRADLGAARATVDRRSRCRSGPGPRCPGRDASPSHANAAGGQHAPGGGRRGGRRSGADASDRVRPGRA